MAEPTDAPTVAATIGHGQFGATGSMVVARSGQTATLLLDGRVLISGGSSDNMAELYDPQTGAFSPTGSMNAVRLRLHTATLLQDGRVLIVGGLDDTLDQNALASAELYDPTTGKFVPTASMAHARSGHTATLLADGRVLVVGGSGDQDSPATAEAYDPKTGQFSSAGSLARARSGQTATLLPGGRVLLVGGIGTGSVSDATSTSAELYDPKTGRFTATGSMATRRWSGHSATLLADGRVFVLGGNTSSIQEVPTASVELYDPGTGKFGAMSSMASARDTQTATLLADGRVLVAGGASGAAELFDPRTAMFSVTGYPIVTPGGQLAGGQTATLLADGRVLIVGGWDGASIQTSSSSAQLYQP
ncbi:MAG TPA: kelch repeat-containing protein [Candidatus Limnocylindrales bacterium]